MKKSKGVSFRIVLSIVMSIGLALLSGCDPSNKENLSSGENNQNSGNSNNGGATDDSRVYSAVEQKEFLEDAAVDFLNMFPTQNFKSYADFAREISDIYEDYDWDYVESWGKDAFELCRELLSQNTIKTGESEWITWKYVDYECTQNYDLLLTFSNFTGCFTANNHGQWNYSNSNDLKFVFKDKAGNDCVIRLATGGGSTPLKLPTYKDRSHKTYEDYDGSITTYKYYEYIDRYKVELVVPEIINLSLTKGGQPVVEVNLTTDIRSLNDSYLDLSTSILGVNAELKLDNGYRFIADNVLYEGNKSLLAQAHAFKDNDELLSVKVSALLQGFPSMVFSDEEKDKFEEYFTDRIRNDNSTANDVNFKIDIQKKVQIVGTVTNARKLYDYIDKAYEFKDEETRFKQYINNANEVINIGLYFNDNNVKQASAKLEAFPKNIWNYGENRVRWDSRPVIVLSDGSQTSTFDDYFDEREFKRVINLFESLIDDYEDMVD